MTEQTTEQTTRQTTEQAAAPAAVSRSVTVRASVQRALTVFTEGFTTWWPPDHHIGTADLREAVMEPRAGGRWFERSVDGAECDWGRVLAWEPPHRLLLAWHLSPDWTFDPDPERASEIEVRFQVEGQDLTRVELEHRKFERHGPRGGEVGTSVAGPQGWSMILARYAATAGA